MACRWSAVRVRLAPLIFSISIKGSQGLFRRSITFVPTCPLTSKQYLKYLCSFPKGKKKKKGRQPISTEHIQLLCESLKRDNKLGLRAILILSAAYGISISEIATEEFNKGKVEIITLKKK